MLTFATLFSLNSFAQIDLKINPIGALFNNPDISAELILNENLGVEAKLGLEYGTTSQNFIEYNRSGISITQMLDITFLLMKMQTSFMQDYTQKLCLETKKLVMKINRIFQAIAKLELLVA